MITKDLHGIVFNSFNYKENDLIVDVLCLEHGFIQLYIRGGQKTTSKSFFIFKLFNIITFDVSRLDIENLSNYKSGNVDVHFDYTKLNYNQISAVMLISETLLKIKKTDEFNIKSYYQYLYKIIDALNKNNMSPFFLINLFLYKTLNILGCSLELKQCVMCENKKDIVLFDLDMYGFVCKDCESNSIKYLKDKEILNYLFYLKQNKEVKISNENMKMIFNILIELLNDNTGVYLLSSQYIYKEDNK